MRTQSDDPEYIAEARRIEGLKAAYRGQPVTSYYLMGYRQGLTDSEHRATVNAALLATDTDTADIGRAARAHGYHDGLHWRTPELQAGLVRLLRRQSGLSAREWADSIGHGERTVRRWTAGTGPIKSRMRRRLWEMLLNGGP